MSSSRSGYESGATPRGRSRLVLVIAVAAAAVLVGGIVALGLVDVAPPPQSVEKTVPNDRLSR